MALFGERERGGGGGGDKGLKKIEREFLFLVFGFVGFFVFVF
jgi:hypothetical protein